MQNTSIGFTGTRAGLTPMQRVTLRMRLEEWYLVGTRRFNHGLCKGADIEACYIAVEVGFDDIHEYPCTLTSQQGHIVYPAGVKVTVHPVKPPLERNRDIVRDSDRMIAIPKEYREVMRGSGTWATIRYTRKIGKPLGIIWPSGNDTWEYPS